MNFNCSINQNIIDKGDPRSAGWGSYGVSTEDLTGAVKMGYAFSPGVINPEFFANPMTADGKLRTKPKEADILNAQIFGIDIDNDKKVHNPETKKYDKTRLTEEEGYTTYAEVSENEWIKKYALFVYTTPSHTPEWNKFRIVFLLPNVIDDIPSYKNAVEIFIKKFNADPACKNIDRMFFGSQNCEMVIYDQQITEEEMERILVRDAEEDEGIKSEDKTYQNYHQNNLFEVTPEQAEKMLECIPREMDYNSWGKVVSAIGNTFDEGTAVRLIENWSPDKTYGTAYKIQHRSEKPQIGSVIWLATQNGYDKTELYGGIKNGFPNKNGTSGKKGEKLTAEEEKQKQSQVEIVEKYLNEKYKLRYNTMKGYTEYMTGPMTIFTQMTDRDTNTIWKNLQKRKLNVRKATLDAVIDSDFVENFHPLKHYFEHLPEWDRENHFDKFVKRFTVQEGQEKQWNLYFTKWIVGVVACAIERGINHTCPVLVGTQSIGKTTIINKLVPKELKEYYATGAINPKDKDSKLLVVENFLINLDELETSGYEEIGHLKSLMTIEDVTIRRPFGRRAETMRRHGSFIASVNKGEFLSDLTGTRRFLAVDVKEIKFQEPLDIDQLYAQAYYELTEQNFQYWFDKEETQTINESNEKFMFFSSEEELIVRHLKPYNSEDKTVVGPSGIVEQELMTATDIFDYLQKLHPNTKLSLRRLGQVLKNTGFQQKLERLHGGKVMRVYSVTKLQSGDFSFSGKNENEVLF